MPVTIPPTGQAPIDVQVFPPSGFDRADGSPSTNPDNSTFPGTPTPDGVVFVIQADGTFSVTPIDATFFEEFPDSPTIERAEQCTIQHKWACDAATAYTIISSYGRGSLFLDSSGVYTRLLSNTMQYQKGGYCTIAMTSEATSFDPPPDEFELETIELNPEIFKHPRYSNLTYQDRNIVRQNNNGDSVDLQTTLNSIVSSISDPLRKSQAQEALNKLYKGIDTFYLPGFRLSWTQYFWAPQAINPGGYIENPIADGGLPYYFWSLDGTENSDFTNTIFSDLSILNSNIYGDPLLAPELSWLRQQDTLHLQRTWFRLTRTWLGGPLAQWDKELYTVPSLPYATGSAQT